MKHKKLFSKLFPSYLLTSILGLAILLLITRFAFRNFYYNETSKNLTQKARLIESDITSLVEHNSFNKVQASIKASSRISENRISVVLPNGIVIADSSHDPEKMENHKLREEVKTAFNGGVGRSIRFSPTLGESHLYIAIPLKKSGKVIGVLRNSVSVEELQTSLWLLTTKVLLWSFLLLILLTYFIYYQAKKISSPLEEIKRQVEAFTSGNFVEKIKTVEASTEEVSSLFNAVHIMSEKIQTQLQKINKQKNEQVAIFASMLEGVITIYPDMRIYHINQAAINLFNFEGNQTIKGTPLSEVVQSKQICTMAEKLVKDQKILNNEFEYKSDKLLNVQGTILRTSDEGMLGAVLVINDITKIRALENHRKDFVANVSHELKTPLTAIQGYLETIRDGDVDDKKTLNKFLDIINKHSMRLKRIIEDLLELSAIEKESEVGGLVLETKDINSVIMNVISLCQEKAETKGIHLAYKQFEAVAKINAPLLEQAIINLLDNALKYGPENSVISISVNKVNQKFEISVTDKGQGIASIHHSRLFERFYSVDKARSRELGGSGLGLSIVKHIALSHNGNIRVESELGTGSSFIIELPV